MLIDTDTMIPWKSNDYNENLLVDFLNQGCRWQGPYSYGPKEEFRISRHDRDAVAAAGS